MPAKKKGAGGKSATTAGRLRIRMFRQGLGDCFLLTFDNKVHVLIDCGVIVGTQAPEPLMTRVVQSIRDATKGKGKKGKVDVLVVTHEHWDHVSGFKQARKTFEEIDFKEVWMAWTEEDGNTLADRLREERRRKKKALKAAAERLAKSKDKGSKSLGTALAEVLGFSGISLKAAAADGGDTAEAMQYALKRGKDTGSDLKFLHPGQQAFALPGAKNVRVYVLGPPEDEKLLKRSDPSKAHSEVYLSLSDSFLAAVETGSTDAAVSEAAIPFAVDCRIAAAGGKPPPEASTPLRKLVESHYFAPEEAYRTIEEDWLAGAGTLALKLDSDTNNTSLVLAFEFIDTGDVFLFPGDAQVGNWVSWDNYKWNVKDKDGNARVVTAGDLLARTLFYKVGHHGSHNATLQEKGLERMIRTDLVAMIPVNQAMAKKKTWKMPWSKLRQRLEVKCSSLIIQDEAEAAAKPKRGRVVVDRGKAGEPSLYADYIV
jgi:L-ascorbate metabolism protein UlaG (beta-lactamase superfamily)